MVHAKQMTDHLQPAVNFDAGHDALISQHIHEGLAVCT